MKSYKTAKASNALINELFAYVPFSYNIPRFRHMTYNHLVRFWKRC